MNQERRITTGFPALDEILDGLRIGDNVVWKVDTIEDYRYFVAPFVRHALNAGTRVVYLRFGQHPPLIEPDPAVTVYQLDARLGFDTFATRIYDIVTAEGREVHYLFDCLSELLSAWATDLMIGNFFRVTCPYLYDLDTVAYFALIRDRHSFRTIARIRETTQVLIDLYNREGTLYVHPLKVWQRHSPTMFLPHRKEGERFVPLADSLQATSLLRSVTEKSIDSTSRQLDHWHRLFLQAEDLAADAAASAEQEQMVDHLCRHLVGREERILALAREFFTLPDLLDIKARMVGTGFIGGKATGMLLANAILLKGKDRDWSQHLEAHDSFYVGSNVYFSYIVHNGLWKPYMRQKTPEGYFEAAGELRREMLAGTFPEQVREGLQKVLDYYGQYPIIVRSSSLLEDGFGNAFAGKYDSFFLPNQGAPEERYAALEDAIRRIFASTMSEDALAYRLQRGLDRQDEQMALLIQRVSGAYRKHYYFPDLAGVGVSYNTFVWDKEMDPKAGMLRLVLGLGTRAVDRVEGDYPRIVALDAPLKKPHKGFADTRKFAQRDLDLLNVNTNQPETVALRTLLAEGIDLPIARYAVRDQETMDRLAERGRKEELWLPTFDPLLADGTFSELFHALLKRLEQAYHYPVDVEFTVNFTGAGAPRINVVQCRPLQTKGQKARIEIPQDIPADRILFTSEGNFMGGNISQRLKWLIWVDPLEYTRLSLSDKHDVARLIGRLNRRIADRQENPTLLMGPGRWGTSTPALGVPISFAEINNITALAEVAFSSGDLMPELSFGSHFFQDLVETDIFYLALFPESSACRFDAATILAHPNALEGLMPASSRFKQVVRVLRLGEPGLRLMADVVSQRLVCFKEGDAG
ncbi:PEP/pyruvate-binding domain-containing protein [Desulfuromonas carbonis]|uniref:PEP/pyruvate-binding domain-containing protein n=1 Tax=Desulfuromonas sp. DDH964 TaxID=1823759 RepID=UPI00078E78B4|nr:PEP/pyruvate-binding domain-containing protein [Desulfuromonas sp. DDH964]AMV71466.1 phosphoenolpyruvate synthase [Desulfuromonas sp. DDH964]